MSEWFCYQMASSRISCRRKASKRSCSRPSTTISCSVTCLIEATRKEIRRRLDNDRQFLPYFEQETTKLPQFYLDLMRKDLGVLWEWLPAGALSHDPNAYSKSERSKQELGILQ